MSLKLDRTLAWTKSLASASTDAAAELAMLNDLQGNILEEHGRRHTCNSFVAFDRQMSDAAKRFVAHLGQDVPSALDQLTQTQVFGTSGVHGDTFIALMLSASGYDEMGEITAKPKDRLSGRG